MKKILLVDDDKIFLNILKETIEADPDFRDCQVMVAEDGSDALKIMDTVPVDLVVSDICMPNLDGLEMLSKIREQGRGVPVFFITAYGTPELEDKAFQKGALKFFSKPVNIPELLQNIKGFFDSSTTGYLEGISVADFVQVVLMSRKNCCLEVSSSQGLGKLYFVEGEIVHAEKDGKLGEEAALEILGWDNVKIQICTRTSHLKTVSSSSQELLLEALKRKDEAQRLKSASDAIHELFEEEKGDVQQEEEGLDLESDIGGFSKEDVRMKQEQIDKILDKLSGIEGSYGGAIVSRDGMVIASKVDKRFANDKIAALASEAVKICNRVIQEAHFGSPQQMVIEGTEGKMCIVATGKGGIFINILGSNDLSLGMARIVLEEAAEEFKEIV